MNDVDWAPALVVLALGLAAGAAFTWRARRAGLAPAAVAESPSLAAGDLQGKLDALLQQLRELEYTAVERSPEQLAAERRTLELGAARTLRELDRLAPALAREAAAGERTLARGWQWGTGTVAALGLLLMLVSRSIEERKDGATLTGNTPGQSRSGAREQAEIELAGLRAAVERAPGDLEKRLDLARAYLSRRDLIGVFRETSFVLERSPGEPRALGYQALVRLAMGEGDLALQMLRQALETRPDFVEGYVHLAIVYSRMGRAKDAARTIETAIGRFPEEAPALRRVAAALRRAAPGEAARAAANAEAAGGPGVSGTVDLDPALKGQVRAGSLLFVMARPAGLGAGPPLAAKRIPVISFPVAFRLGAADSMMGEPLPEKVNLQARLDGNGDPGTRDPSDPQANLDGVARDGQPVRLVLRRRAP